MTAFAPEPSLQLVAGIDLTRRSEAAFNTAVQLAIERDAALTVVHVIPADLPERVAKAHAEYAETLVQDHVSRANTAGLKKITPVIAHGRDYEALVEQADIARADVIVLGTHRQRGGMADILGTTIDRVLRLSSKPVLLARKPYQQPYQRILVAVDFSAISRRAIDTALTLFPEAEFLAVNTWGWRRKPNDGASGQQSELGEAHRLALKSLVHEVVQMARPSTDDRPPRVFELVAPGLPSVVVPELAHERLIDLIVVGTHARDGLSRFLIGSVAEEIMLRTEADILAIPPAHAVPAAAAAGVNSPVVA